MNIDNQLKKQILLSIQSESFNEKISNPKNFSFSSKSYYSNDKAFSDSYIIDYHLDYLINSGFVSGIISSIDNYGCFFFGGSRANLTPYGHKEIE